MPSLSCAGNSVASSLTSLVREVSSVVLVREKNGSGASDERVPVNAEGDGEDSAEWNESTDDESLSLSVKSDAGGDELLASSC